MFRKWFGKKSQRPDPKQLAETLRALIQARTRDESCRILHAHPELLSDEADALLVRLINAAREQKNADVEKVFIEYRDLLQRARRDGVDAAFAAKSATVGGHLSAVSSIPAELQPLLEEIARLNRLSEMPRKVALCEQALRLVQRENNPSLWAALQGELANTLRQNPLGSRAENLERAIAHYELALQVYTREAFPEQWAATQNNLAAAYSDRIRGERAENLERAIAHYELALQVLTREAFPEDWAMTQNNLANAYRNRIRGERAGNLERAIAHYELALQVLTREQFPIEHRLTTRNLGDTHASRGDWDAARAAYAQAIQTAEQLFRSAVDPTNQRNG